MGDLESDRLNLSDGEGTEVIEMLKGFSIVVTGGGQDVTGGQIARAGKLNAEEGKEVIKVRTSVEATVYIS